MSSASSADEVADAADDALDDDEAELIEEAKEIARAKRSNMFNEDGVAYAPWLVDQVDEDAMMAAKAMRSMRKRQERDALEEKDGYVSLTEATTSELSSLGLKAKYLGDEVELEWSTEDESENIGFSVQKRRSGSQAWETVRSHTDYAPLKSQGSDGGTYTILADEADGRKSSVCQVGVTIQSASEQLQTKIILGIAALALGGIFAAGLALDPNPG